MAGKTKQARAAGYVIRYNPTLGPLLQRTHRRKVYSPRCDNTTTIANTVLVQEDSLCNGVHSTGQAAQAERVQVFWCGPQSTFAICHEAILYTRCHQVFSYVDGVSQVSSRQTRANCDRPNLVSSMSLFDCQSSDYHEIIRFVIFPTDGCYVDHAVWLWLRCW